MHPVAERVQHLGHQQPELAIAQDGDACATGNPHLLQKLAGSRQRLDEHSRLGGDSVRHDVEVALGQRKKFLKRPRIIYDSQNASLGTMPAHILAAPVAVSARQIDLAHYATAYQRLAVRLYHLTHELVPRNTGEAVIAALQLQIRIADPGANEPDQRESPRAFGHWKLTNFDAPSL